MSALKDRIMDGGFRWEMHGDEIVIYADADKLADTDMFDTPEVAVLRFKKKDVKRTAAKAWHDVKAEAIRFGKNIAAEWRRFQKRRGAK